MVLDSIFQRDTCTSRWVSQCSWKCLICVANGGNPHSEVKTQSAGFASLLRWTRSLAAASKSEWRHSRRTVSALRASREVLAVANVFTDVCPGCDKRLNDASDAIRRHASEMNTAIYLLRSGRLTEEERQDFKATLSASFNEAQSAWDASVSTSLSTDS